MTLVNDRLDYYASIGASLFPMSAGKKAPFGIIKSFKKEATTDRLIWQIWQTEHPGCNWGVYAAGSRLIIVDIDTKLGRDAAWAMWHELCVSWGFEQAITPHVQSPSGGWHVYFKVPEGVDALSLRQPDAVKKHINIRCIGYTVAAGSYCDGTEKETDTAGPYQLMGDHAPYECPDALLTLVTRAPVTNSPAASNVGGRDRNDVAGLLDWLNERDQFESYEDWLHVGMALKLEYGDDGFDLWALTFDACASTPDVARVKWCSFGSEIDSNSVTLNTFLDRAHKLGWRGSVRKTAASMWDSVAQMAITAAAAAPAAGPQRTESMLFAGQAELVKKGEVILKDFLSDTGDAPINPRTVDIPQLPEVMKDHGLYELLNDSIKRAFSLAEQRGFKPARINRAMAVLLQVHPQTCETVIGRLQGIGATVQESKIRVASIALEEDVARLTVTHDKWEYDEKGKIQSDNPDNIRVFLDMVGLEVRWNNWLDQMEMRGGEPGSALYFKTWSRVDDNIVSTILGRAKRTKTRFMASKDFWYEQLPGIAKEVQVDPVLTKLEALQAKWDGVKRLDTWLTVYAHVENDAEGYVTAVGRSIIGGMVQRARQPGCKFDTLVVFHGPQGTGKSTMADIISLRPAWFSDSVQLGMEQKELLIALRGKLVAEVAEMDMRSTATIKSVKAMLSKCIDEAREPWGRATTQKPRRNIFIGTSNEEKPLTDTTGNRRFLPLKISREVLLTELRRDIDQIVAEACVLESQGVDFNIPRNIWAVAAARQEDARQESSQEIILDQFGDAEGPNSYVTSKDVIELLTNARVKFSNAQLAEIMNRTGFKPDRMTINGARTRVWLRGQWGKNVPRYIIEGTDVRLRDHSADMWKGAPLPVPKRD